MMICTACGFHCYIEEEIPICATETDKITLVKHLDRYQILKGQDSLDRMLNKKQDSQ